MTMHDAMRKSKYGEAKRPYYREERLMRDPSMGKYIVCRNGEFHLIWADTGSYVDGQRLSGSDVMSKCQGYDDWEPIN